MLGKTESKRRRGWQRMKWLNSITNLMSMNLSKFWETVKDREVWCAAAHGLTKIQTQLSEWITTTYLGMFGDILVVTTGRLGYWHLVVEVRDAAKHLTTHRKPFPHRTTNDLAQNVNRPGIEKSWPIGKTKMFFKSEQVLVIGGKKKTQGQIYISLESQKGRMRIGQKKIREGDGTPLQYSCLENPMDG